MSFSFLFPKKRARALWELFHRPRLNILDIGSSGGVNPIWSYLPNAKIYTCDIDSDQVEFNKETHSIPFLLSDASKTDYFFEMKHWSVSSAYPPNPQNEYFDDRFNSERQVIKTYQKKYVTIDELTLPDLDILKSDTQGSEYDILKGGKETILDSLPLLCCETWTYDAYVGIKKTGAVLDLIESMGYECWDIEPAAAWSYKSAYSDLNIRQRLTGLNLMCSPQLQAIQKFCIDKPARALSKALCYALYGYWDCAKVILSNSDLSQSAVRKIDNYARIENSLISRALQGSQRSCWRKKIFQKLGITFTYPPYS